MIVLTRRAALLGSVSALSGCAWLNSVSVGTTLQSLDQDGALVVAGLTALYPGLGNAADGVLTSVVGAVTDAEAALAALKRAVTAAAAAPSVQDLEDAVTAVVTALAPLLPLAAPWMAYLQAAVSLVQAMRGSLPVATTAPPAATAATATVLSLVPAMDVATARKILGGLKAG